MKAGVLFTARSISAFVSHYLAKDRPKAFNQAFFLDAQVAEKIAQKFALQRLVVFGDGCLPTPQVVIYEN
ncbi:MAG TPA: hypothetical protein VF749_06385 [Candidatus Acidoferrum sp.]